MNRLRPSPPAPPRPGSARARDAAAALLVAVLLAGCGSFGGVRDFIEDTYRFQGAQDDSATYASPDPAGTTVATIAEAVTPMARGTDGVSEYLRYDDDIVIVSAGGAGSTVRVEDLDGRYSRGFFVFLGPGFRPGSPVGGAGGPGDAK